MCSPPRIHKIQLLSIGEGGLLSTCQLRSEQGSFKERGLFARVAKGNKPLELDPPTGNQLGLQICNGIKERDYWMAITKFDMESYLLLPFFEEFRGQERYAWQTHPMRISDKWVPQGHRLKNNKYSITMYNVSANHTIKHEASRLNPIISAY